MDLNSVYQTIGLIGTVVTVLGFVYAFYTTRLFSKGIKLGSLLHIRALINRMEEEKQEHDKASPQWKAMHHTQQELETLFNSLKTTFNISDKRAPL